MEPRHFLRVEGLAVPRGRAGDLLPTRRPALAAGRPGASPDLSLLGYLAGSRVGSLTYNVVHTYALPLALGAAGLWLALLVALVWAGHIGANRLFGYGLKFESGFTDTHLSTQPVPGPLRDDPN